MFNIHTIRALKGAPMSIIVAMLLAKQPVGESWLISVTGYSQNTIRNGCKFLIESQMIQRNRRYEGYILVNGALQLPLGVAEIDESQNLTIPPVTTTSTFNMNDNNDNEGFKAEEEIRESKNDPRLVLLYSAGVMEPTASRLLEKAWVTNEYLDAHIEKATREGTPIPLLIHRIRSHDPMPEDRNDQSPESYRRSWL